MLELIEEHFIDASEELVQVGHASPAPAAKLEEIVLYPVKSCGALRPEKWRLSSAGLEMDRQWAVMRGKKAVTQKQLRYTIHMLVEYPPLQG